MTTDGFKYNMHTLPPSSSHTPNDDDLRIDGDDTTNIFARRLHSALLQRVVWTPSSIVVNASNTQDREDRTLWMKKAHKLSGDQDFWRQTHWLKEYMRLYGIDKGSAERLMDTARADNFPLKVERIMDTSYKQGGVPGTPLPIMNQPDTMHGSRSVGHGAFSLIFMAPGTQIGQFSGSVHRMVDRDEAYKGTFAANYILNINYAGVIWTVNPVSEKGGVRSIESGAMLNEPSSDGRGLHGNRVAAKRRCTINENGTVSLKKNRTNAHNGSSYDVLAGGHYTGGGSFNVDGMVWQDGEPHALRTDVGFTHEVVPVKELALEGENKARANIVKASHERDVVHAQEKTTKSSNGFPKKDSRTCSGLTRMAQADKKLTDAVCVLNKIRDIRKKMVANVVCCDPDIPLCFYNEMQRSPTTERSLFALHHASIHADGCFLLSEIVSMCDKVSLFRTYKHGKVGMRKFEYKHISQHANALQSYDQLNLKASVFPGCERAVLVLPTPLGDGPFPFEYEALDARRKVTGDKVIVLRFFRKRRYWAVPTRQLAARVTNDHIVPYGMFKASCAILPEDELLFMYTNIGLTTRGLAAESSGLQGALWSECPPTQPT